MQDVLNLLNKVRVCFLATVDGNEPRVRPFQFQFERDGKLWFCTARNKEVYAQLQQNPMVEIALTDSKMVTLRLRGKAELGDDMDVKREIIRVNNLVRSIYGSADNPQFTAFNIQHGEAIIFDFSGNPPKLVAF